MVLARNSGAYRGNHGAFMARSKSREGAGRGLRQIAPPHSRCSEMSGWPQASPMRDGPAPPILPPNSGRARVKVGGNGHFLRPSRPGERLHYPIGDINGGRTLRPSAPFRVGFARRSNALDPHPRTPSVLRCDKMPTLLCKCSGFVTLPVRAPAVAQSPQQSG
jgi:hypothetical protein